MHKKSTPTNFSFDTKNGKYDIKNPSKESTDNLRQILAHKKFVLVVTLVFSFLAGIVFQSYWPLVVAAPFSGIASSITLSRKNKSP